MRTMTNILQFHTVLHLPPAASPTATTAATAVATSTPASSTSSTLTSLMNSLGVVIGILIAFVVVFWLSLIIWTFRDIRSRTQDLILQIAATVLVAVFFVGGLFIYMILRPRQTLAEIYERQLEEESLLAEMTERQTCSNCHARIEPDFQICPSCGQKLKRSCPKCERLLELRWAYCPYCATNLAGGLPMQGMPGMQGMAGMPPMQGMPIQGSPSASGIPMSGPRY